MPDFQQLIKRIEADVHRTTSRVEKDTGADTIRWTPIWIVSIHHQHLSKLADVYG